MWTQGPGPGSLRSPCRWSEPGRWPGAGGGPSAEREKGRQGSKSTGTGAPGGADTDAPRRTGGRLGGAPPRSVGHGHRDDLTDPALGVRAVVPASSPHFGFPQSTPAGPVPSGRAGTRHSHSTDGETEARGPGLSFRKFMAPEAGGPTLSASDHVAPVAGSAERSAEVQVRAGPVPLRPLSSCVDSHALPVSSRGRPSMRACVLMSSSCKDPGHPGSGPPLSPPGDPISSWLRL